MKNAHAILGTALLAGVAMAAALLAPSERALAAADDAVKLPPACLQNDLIYNFNVVNPRRVQVTDRNNRLFTVQLTGGCIGLTNLATISFRTTTSLGCLQKGDRLSFREPTLGVMSCSVTSVEPAIAKPST